MDFKFDGIENFLVGGVVDPAQASPAYKENMHKYKKLNDRVFLLYEPAQKMPEFDMVFIHGIGSDEFKCWCNDKNIIWPASFLPQDFPQARIMSAGYAHSLWSWKAKDDEKKEARSGAPIESTGASSKAVSPSNAEVANNPTEFLKDVGRNWQAWWDKDSVRIKDAALPSPSSSFPLSSPQDPVGTVGVEKDSKKTFPSVGTAAAPRSDLFEAIMRQYLAEDVESATNRDGEASNGRQLESVQLVAADLAERLLSPSVGVGQRPVVFVVHSMGGLIIKQMIVSLFQLVKTEELSDGTLEQRVRKESVRVAEQAVLSTRAVVFYGTPHFGSGLASVITGMKRYYQTLGGLTPTSVVSGLGDHNRYRLVNLNDRFFDAIERLAEYRPLSHRALTGADRLLEELSSCGQGTLPLLDPSAAHSGGGVGGSAVQVLSFGETQRLGGLIRVVEPESSNPMPDDPRYPFFLLDGDHSEINRPSSKIKPAYALLHGFLDRMSRRGLLREPLTATSATDSADATETALNAVAVQYEKDWSSIMASSASSTSAASLTGFHQTQMALRDVRVLLSELESLLRHFFGRFIPSEFDGIFQLGADMMSFIQEQNSDNLINNEFLFLSGSLDFPLRLFGFWVKTAIEIIRTLEIKHDEEELMGTSGSLTERDLAELAPGLQRHLSAKELEELRQIGAEIGLLQGEWEVLRRYVATDKKEKGNISTRVSQQFPALSSEQAQMLLFARSMCSIASVFFRDEGCVFNLMAYYFNTTIEQITLVLAEAGETVVKLQPLKETESDEMMAEQKQLLSQENPFSTLIAEGLDLFSSGSPTTTAAVASAEISLHREKRGVFLDAVSPVLQSAAFFLQGCYYMLDISPGAWHNGLMSDKASRAHGNDSSSELFRLSLEFTRKGRDEQQKRKRRLARKSSSSKKNSSFWSWYTGSSKNSLEETLRTKQLHSELLSVAFELVVGGLAIQALLPTLLVQQPHGHITEGAPAALVAPDAGAAVPLYQMITAAYRTYHDSERGLRGELIEKDVDKPFVEALSEAINTSALVSKVKAVKKPEDFDAVTQEAKKQLRNALSVVLEELNTDDKPAEKMKKTEKTTSAARAFSIERETTFFMNSLVHLWTSIRKGEASTETPQYFAHTSMVLWWLVEEQTAQCINLLIEVSEGKKKKKDGGDKKTTDASEALVEECRRVAALIESKGKNPLRATLVRADSEDVSKATTETNKHAQECQPRIRSRWETTDALRTFAKYLADSEVYNAKALQNAIAGAVVDDSVAPSVYETRRMLQHALEFDRSNVVANCVAGHCAFLHQSDTPDAAHSYLRVLCEERSPRRPIYRAAAVGLGWAHLHQLHQCMTKAFDPLDLVVADPLSVERAPPGFLEFCAQVGSMRERYQAQCTSLLPGASRPEELGRMREWQRHQATKTLDKATNYFSTVLKIEPRNIGALCGLGRSRLLSVQPSDDTRASHSHLVRPNHKAASRLFHAALQPSGDGRCHLGTLEEIAVGKCLGLHGLHRSCAAYWVGELTAVDPNANQGNCNSPSPSAVWFETALVYNPANDWAMTSLAMDYLHPRQGRRLPSARETQQGLGLVQRAIAINPRNQWALWLGMTWTNSKSQKEMCQRSLRTLLSGLRVH